MGEDLLYYTCDDCKEVTYFSLNEIGRAARMKCMRCGGIRLEPCSKQKSKLRKDLVGMYTSGSRLRSSPSRGRRRRIV